MIHPTNVRVLTDLAADFDAEAANKVTVRLNLNSSTNKMKATAIESMWRVSAIRSQDAERRITSFK